MRIAIFQKCMLSHLVVGQEIWLFVDVCDAHVYEPSHDKTSKKACAPSEDSDQPGHLPSLIRVFAVRMKKYWALNYILSAQWRLGSDWADAQADLSLRWAHSHFVGFVMKRLIYQLKLPYLYVVEQKFQSVFALFLRCFTIFMNLQETELLDTCNWTNYIYLITER